MCSRFVHFSTLNRYSSGLTSLSFENKWKLFTIVENAKMKRVIYDLKILFVIIFIYLILSAAKILRAFIYVNIMQHDTISMVNKLSVQKLLYNSKLGLRISLAPSMLLNFLI